MTKSHRQMEGPGGTLIGVIADTHGLLRPEAIAALEGTERIIHAGDIGDLGILERLESIAPVIAVRGNVDTADWARTLPSSKVVEVGKVSLYVIHDVQLLDLDPARAGFHAVISGHSHRPAMVERGGVLYLNPGSAGPRRFDLPVSLALLNVHGDSVEGRMVRLCV